MNECMNEWMNKWMNEWVNDEWMKSTILLCKATLSWWQLARVINKWLNKACCFAYLLSAACTCGSYSPPDSSAASGTNHRTTASHHVPVPGEASGLCGTANNNRKQCSSPGFDSHKLPGGKNKIFTQKHNVRNFMGSSFVLSLSGHEMSVKSGR